MAAEEPHSQEPPSFAGKDLTRPNFAAARLRDPYFKAVRVSDGNFEGAKFTGGYFENANISGWIRGLRVNGVDVAPLVEAELDRQFPERLKLRASDPAGLLEAWTTVEGIWDATIDRARALPDSALSERVDEEWSLLETLRHLIFATDAWHRHVVLGEPWPYHPWGVVHSGGPAPADLGIDTDANPSVDEVLTVRRDRMNGVRATIETATPSELKRKCVPSGDAYPPGGTNSVRRCLQVVLNEEWWHSHYANRDLEIIEARS